MAQISRLLKLVPSAVCVCAFLSEYVQNWHGAVYAYTCACLSIAHTLMSLIRQNIIETFRAAHIKDVN